MAKELFLEIGTEEIPAGFLPKAMADMEGLIRKELESARIGFGEVKTMATPRRLALVVKNVSAQQTDAEITTMGPAKKVAFNDDGTTTKAGEGFARGQGVDASALSIIATEKGEYVAVTKKEIGVATAGLLAEILPRLINNIPFKKSMRWGDQEVRFARPMHWIVALFDGTVIPFAFGNVQSGSMSRGHRFMANTSFPVRDFGHYLEECERHFVIPDPAKRKEIISREIERVAKAAGGNVLPDEGLLEQVTYLVEYPSAVHGTFSAEFLAVPKEVLITSMREHQRYFSLVDDKGKLLPGFITINNTLTEDPSVVVKGNEMVLRARLSDARFFFEEDKKVPLEKRVEALKSVLYQAKLGTSYEKMERFRTLAEGLAEQLQPPLKAKVFQAATLCKADLVTGMVGEFPEVQGIMGREYALLQGVDAEVARAIAEHYLPNQAGGELPASDTGAFVSIADKVDTICGCFSVGLIPSGSADPYALRRAALGIINIILAKGYNLPLIPLVTKAIGQLEGRLTRKKEEVLADVLDFFKGRFINLLTDRFPADVVEAVVAVSFDNLVEATAKIEALAQFKKRDDFEPLAVAFKRVCNIVKEQVTVPVDDKLFQDAAEGTLFQSFKSASSMVEEKVVQREYLAALTQIASLKGAVDDFFDKVMVMAEDEGVRNNRLALLQEIKSLFRDIADFGKLTA
ncbi:glycyl-tRNA synthetase, beta subunit [Geotalea daltonii FRC-32]|uniref:Glycine--tRNA ligase beta subunit n=1 Tax=Geotalea daltonii (strain DSM 22248 / JCM 15807 / FRC-32) TaxID=316067 RepID=SYGB_GEODF|nr:glycine--tRNA ligase subunit beta [Geotalea daltonii]B9M5V4.1 RecName: Full=Glycine--tRNA ligase beta subunit; AltName: Full=Glycyl-tRNA synthetase beta subunit; Short=GlyRS [Geotalea daltonii FRC-32]ACM19935.1 glycyl-tRNA synthetase, beta subunit [Geotalea daltonii FRC-32]